MQRVRFTILVMAVCVLAAMAVEDVCTAAAQDSTTEPRTVPATPAVPSSEKLSTKTIEANLRVRLRLEDESPFVGVAELQLMPSEGGGIKGTRTETEGETLFSGLSPGEYRVEASAPGYLPVELSTEIEAGHRERILYVVMKVRAKAEEDGRTKEETTKTAAPARGNGLLAESKATASGGRDFWEDHELEKNVPAVEPGVACPTEQILEGVAERMKEFVSNLEKFTAKEEVEHYPLDAGNNLRTAEKRRFDYVVVISRNRIGTILLDEYRDGNTDPSMFPANVATEGLPAMELIFHPVEAGDFQFTCEGLGQANGRTTWQMHFAQRNDRPVRIRAYEINRNVFPVHLEGRAWIDAGNYQVVRLESELMKPVPKIWLTKEHMVVEYAPVQFRAQKMQIWLPHEAELYVERHDHRYYRRHTFTDFRLFDVETAQGFQAPKGSYIFTNNSDREITGVLTVIPEEGSKQTAIRVSVVVPARGKVFKVVGPGKDVDLPSSTVASATFVHDGKAESVQVEANMVKETTLDLIPETAVTMKP